MKTQVIMKRPLFGVEISQQSKTTFLSATDLVRAGNKWRVNSGLGTFDLSVWFQKIGVKEFISAMEKEYGVVKISGRGRGHHTWLHPLLFIDLALALSPELKIEVYKWLYDYLIEFRNDSGDSYKIMCGAIYGKISNKSKFKDYMIQTASRIKLACGVTDWQRATQKQLKLRDLIHNNISLLSDVLGDIDQAVRIGIEKSVQNTIEKGE